MLKILKLHTDKILKLHTDTHTHTSLEILSDLTIHRSDVWTVAGDAGGGVDPLGAGGGRLLPHPGLAAPDAGHGGRDLGPPGGFLMDCLYPSMSCVRALCRGGLKQPAILYPKFVLIY